MFKGDSGALSFVALVIAVLTAVPAQADDSRLRLDVQIIPSAGPIPQYRPGRRVIASGGEIEICSHDIIWHKPFILLQGVTGVSYWDPDIAPKSCVTYRAPEVQRRTRMTIACEIHKDEHVRIMVLPRISQPSIAKTPFVKKCVAGELGGEPQSAIACGCLYDKLVTEASEHAREAMFIAATEGLAAQQAYANEHAVGTELMQEVYGYMLQCGMDE